MPGVVILSFPNGLKVETEIKMLTVASHRVVVCKQCGTRGLLSAPALTASRGWPREWRYNLSPQ